MRPSISSLYKVSIAMVCVAVLGVGGSLLFVDKAEGTQLTYTPATHCNQLIHFWGFVSSGSTSYTVNSADNLNVDYVTNPNCDIMTDFVLTLAADPCGTTCQDAQVVISDPSRAFLVLTVNSDQPTTSVNFTTGLHFPEGIVFVMTSGSSGAYLTMSGFSSP